MCAESARCKRHRSMRRWTDSLRSASRRDLIELVIERAQQTPRLGGRGSVAQAQRLRLMIELAQRRLQCAARLGLVVSAQLVAREDQPMLEPAAALAHRAQQFDRLLLATGAIQRL